MPYHYTPGAPLFQDITQVNTFEFYRFRFHFRAVEPLRFPPGEGANRMRSGFGAALRETAGAAEYHRLFEPGAARGNSPSGLADWPRPFLLRAAQLDGAAVPAGDGFFLDVHIFDPANPRLELLRAALARMAERGIGPGRGKAELARVEQLDLADGILGHPAIAPSSLGLGPVEGEGACSRLTLQFVTPTELKWNGFVVERPEFAILFARLRDRIATLRALYGAGPLALDFRAEGERAASVRLVRCDLQYREAWRRSARTGQVHSLGGFTGLAEYAGELREFLPWLRAARWVGVGRQTVWGKGDVRVIP